jgi:hypothetical protein
MVNLKPSFIFFFEVVGMDSVFQLICIVILFLTVKTKPMKDGVSRRVIMKLAMDVDGITHGSMTKWIGLSIKDLLHLMIQDLLTIVPRKQLKVQFFSNCLSTKETSIFRSATRTKYCYYFYC